MSKGNTSQSKSKGYMQKQIDYWRQELTLLGVIAVLFIGVGYTNETFLSTENLSGLLASNAYIAIAAIGMSVIIITGHIDVSVGALIGVLAMVSGYLAVNDYPIWLAWAAPVLLGMVVNALIGMLVAYGNIPSIVVTLGMLSVLKGGLISVTGGVWLTNLPTDYLIAQQKFFGIPSSVWTMALMTIAGACYMHWSERARSFYALGSNADAARVVGIKTRPTVVFAFSVHGFFAGIAAVFYATQLQVIQSTVPVNLELTIIAAAVVGGVSILGGRGNVVGATLAAILFATITSALVYVGVSAYWLRAVQGALILATVLADIYSRKNFK